MNTTIRIHAAVVAGCFLASSVGAEDYDYELSLDYDRSSSDSRFVSTFNGVPDPSLGVGTTSSDNDDIDLTGTWYYSGLSDSEGPKARAAFLSRASGLALRYGRSDGSGSFAFSSGGILPPFTGNDSTRTNALSANLRHTWRDSGWFMLAGVSRVESEFEATLNGNTSTIDVDATAYSLGVGKYLGKATSVDLNVVDADTDGSDATAVALSLRHIGSIGESWQYGADLVLQRSSANNDEGKYTFRGTLFPSSDIEFGIELSRQERDGGFSNDSMQVFAGWFVRDHVELTAGYRHDSPDDAPGQDSDGSGFGVGVAFRF